MHAQRDRFDAIFRATGLVCKRYKYRPVVTRDINFPCVFDCLRACTQNDRDKQIKKKKEWNSREIREKD